jgi:hypothetical protein
VQEEQQPPIKQEKSMHALLPCDTLIRVLFPVSFCCPSSKVRSTRKWHSFSHETPQANHEVVDLASAVL